MPSDYNKYEKLVAKEFDRHLIVGDIHGQHELLMKLLDVANYDPASDMLYTVGDMIDRGSQSYELVDFFSRHENRESTLGNHEAMVMYGDWNMWYSNGGLKTATSLDHNGETINWLRYRIQDLPLVMDVDTGESTFRIVHAELPSRLDEDLIQIKLGSNHTDKYFDETCIWGRTDISALRHTSGRELGNVIAKNQPIQTYVGHSIVPEPLVLGTRTYLNVPMGQLAMVDALTGKFYQI